MSQLQRGLLAIIITVLCWGGFYPVGKAALTTLGPYDLTVIRYGIAAMQPLVMALVSNNLCARWQLRRSLGTGSL